MKLICSGCNAKLEQATFKNMYIDLSEEIFIITCLNCNFRSAIKLKIYNSEIVFEKEITK